jgi:nickel transport protein
MMLKKCCGAVLLFSVMTLQAWAHDVWLEPAENGMRLVFGHPGEPEPYDPARVQEAYGIGKDGERQTLWSQVRDGEMTLRPASGTAVIIVDFDHGVWTETADEESVNRPKSEVPGYLFSAHERMLHKTLVSWGEVVAKPAGVLLEIVPLANPLTMKPGDELQVQLLYDSKPLADAEIEIMGSMDLYITDDEGKVTLPINEPGFQYIQAIYRVPLENDPGTDALALTASLTFTL